MTSKDWRNTARWWAVQTMMDGLIRLKSHKTKSPIIHDHDVQKMEEILSEWNACLSRSIDYEGEES